jgi:hypothetical protein
MLKKQLVIGFVTDVTQKRVFLKNLIEKKKILK